MEQLLTEWNMKFWRKEATDSLESEADPAKIRARKILETAERAEQFLADVFDTMDLKVNITTEENKEEHTMDIDLSGDDMGVLIGKRGQTLDSLQYLVSLVINKGEEEYIRVKVDTENYRQRRKDTLENLAKNISFKVRRTGRPGNTGTDESL